MDRYFLAFTLGLAIGFAPLYAEAGPPEQGQFEVSVPVAITTGWLVDGNDNNVDPTSFFLLTRPWVGFETAYGLGNGWAVGGDIDFGGFWVGHVFLDLRARATLEWGSRESWFQVFGGWGGSSVGYADVAFDDERGGVNIWVNQPFVVGPQAGVQMGSRSSYFEATLGFYRWQPEDPEGRYLPYLLLGWGWRFSLLP